MHLTADDAVFERTESGSTVVSYPTGDGTQDVSSLERFQLHSLVAGASTGVVVEHERESIWLVRSGSGSVTRSGASGDGLSVTVSVQPKDLLIFPRAQPHSLQASADGPLEFIDVAFSADLQRLGEPLLARPEGIGPAHGEGGTWGEELDNVRIGTRETGVLIKGTEMPPQEGDSCYRYPHSRPHSTLDHMDQNSTLPGARAADHSHKENEEFWFILEGEGVVEHGGAKGNPATTFPVGPGSLIGHPKNLHHTLVGRGSSPVKWYCFCMNRFLTQAVEVGATERTEVPTASASRL